MTIATEGPLTELSAGDRYSAIIHAIGSLGSEAQGLADELDSIVGERLGEYRDQGVAEALGGVLINGAIMLPGSPLRGWEVTVNVPAAQPTNPSFDECRCGWGREEWQLGIDSEKSWAETGNAPEHLSWGIGYGNVDAGRSLHAYLLDLEGDRPLDAINELLSHISNSFIPLDPELKEVFAQHNWVDPIRAQRLAGTLEHLLATQRNNSKRSWKY